MPEDRSINDPGYLGDIEVSQSPEQRQQNAETIERPKSAGYPRDSYKNLSGINSGARGQGNARLKTSGGIPFGNLADRSEEKSAYGQSQVTETPGGHIIEYNDTLGSERILIRHVSGSGIEFRSDGSVVISASNLIFDVRGDENHLVSGNKNMKIAGTINQQSGGDNITDAGGNVIKNSGGTLLSTAAGSKITKIGKNKRTVIAGEETNTTVGPVARIALGGYQNNVKGDMTIRTEGELGIYGSSSLKLTAQKNAVMSSPSVALTGDQVELLGQRGTIGGENMILYAYNGIIGHTLSAGDTVTARTVYGTVSMDTPVVKGDLDGLAKEALVAPDGVVSGSIPSNANIANDTKATAMPTEANISGRQKTQNNGVKYVKVDPGDYMKGSIDRSTNNGLRKV